MIIVGLYMYLVGEKMIGTMLAFVENPEHKEFLTNLYEAHKERMFSYAYGILHDEKLAEDAVNSAFIGIIKNIEKIFSLDVNKIAPYIVISIRNTCYNIQSRRKKFTEKELLTDRIDEGIFEKANFTAADFSYVHKAIGTLSEQSKDMVLLRYFSGYSYREIAEQMNVSVSQVGVVLKRAKAKLKQEILSERGAACGDEK